MALDVGTAFVDIQPKVGAGFFAGLSAKLGGGGGKKLLAAAGLGLGVAVAGGIAAGVALFKIGETFDEAVDSIIVATGASGEALESLEGSFKQVFSDLPVSAADAATAIGEINTRLGLTDEPLEDMARRLLDLSRITDTDIGQNVTDVTRAFGDWGVETDFQGFRLDQLFKVTQDTGIGMSDLTGTMVSFGAPLRQLGFDFEEAAALTGKWNKEGVNTEAIMGGLKIGLGKLSAETDDVPAAFNAIIESIAGAGSAGEANQIAMETFGLRAGPDLAAAVREGRFETEELITSMQGSAGALNDASFRTESFGEKWKRLVNKTLVALEPLATRVFEGMGEALDFLLPHIEPIIAGIGTLASTIMDILRPAFAVIQEVFAIVSGLFDRGEDDLFEFGGAWADIWGQVQEILGVAQVFIEEVLLAIRAFWDEHGAAILAFVKTTWDAIGVVISGVLDVIKGIFQVFIAIFQGDWSKAWEGIKNILAGVWKIIQGLFDQALALLGLTLRIALDALALVWGRIWNSIKSAVSTVWDGILAVIDSAIEGIKETIGTALDFITGIWDTAWKGMREGFETIWNGIVGTLKTIGNSLLGLIERIINNALKALQGAINAADVLAGPFINFPDNALPRISIPRLAEGGSITSGGLVQVHRNELLSLPAGASVIPLDRAMGRPFNITMILDGKVIARATGPHLADDLVLHSGARRSG